MEIADVIKQNVKIAVKKLYGIEVNDVFVEHPGNEDWGDFATNVAIKLSPSLKQSPAEIANKICYELRTYPPDDIFEQIDYVQQGFINLRLSAKWLQNVLNDIYHSSLSYGLQDIGQKKRIALEHSNVNPNKAAHIGHLRNACIGQFIERVYEALGYEVEVQYYANDAGVQVATSLMGMKYVKKFKETNYKKFDHFAWDIYAEMESLISESQELAEERDNLMIELEKTFSPENKEVRELANKILIEQLKTFQKLDIDYDVVVHEADILALDFWKTAFEVLKNNDNVYFAKSGKSKGCWLVSVSDKKIRTTVATENAVEEDKIIVRSNGVPTYTGKDIAYHMWKFGLLGMDFYYDDLGTETQKKLLWATSAVSSDRKAISFTKVDIVFDVIGGEQTYAMDVVKKALGYLGFIEAAKNMTHVNYGFVYLSPKTAAGLGIDVSNGKSRYGMSGRRGWGVKIDDFIDMLDAALKQEHGESEELVDVRNGAIKFEMLKFNTFQDLVFDLDAALDIKGFSGPYLQYTHARACSVLKKAGTERIDDAVESSLLDRRELSLLRWIYRYPQIVKRSALEFAPNLLCSYLFELAKRYNLIYNDLPIINAHSPDQRNMRLLMTECVKIVLHNGLFLLGISSPEHL